MHIQIYMYMYMYMCIHTHVFWHLVVIWPALAMVANYFNAVAAADYYIVDFTYRPLPQILVSYCRSLSKLECPKPGIIKGTSTFPLVVCLCFSTFA